MSPGSAINQMSVNGLEKKFLDEVDGYAQGKNLTLTVTIPRALNA